MIRKIVRHKPKASKKIKSKSKKKNSKNKTDSVGKALTREQRIQQGRDSKGRVTKGCPPLNPKGRPKGSLSLTAILRKILSEPKTRKSKMTKGEDLMKVLLKHAKKGNPKLLDIIMNRLDGKVPDRLFTTETNPLSETEESKLNEIINAGKDREKDEPDDTE